MTKHVAEVVAERCMHYGVIASAMANGIDGRWGVLCKARQRIAWELRRQWNDYGLRVRPTFDEIAKAVGYDADGDTTKKAILREDRNMELAAKAGAA